MQPDLDYFTIATELMAPLVPSGATVATERVYAPDYPKVTAGLYVLTMGPIVVLGRLREEGVRAGRITLYFEQGEETLDVLLTWDPDQYRLFKVLGIVEPT
ncbi:hypothetical protein [Hymenobacter gelipurpurascens]|uniref:hypothetical protein n=1 Tax=Hymenobacter gelipurpurascens TaxID=89968 RepID=UPI000B58A321|nr:hypothetical protein [Hymenobacter gelipurpurascens]